MPGRLAAKRLALRQFLARQPGHLVDIGAGGKSALACTGQDHRLDRVVLLVLGQRLVELARQPKAQRIELVRPVQRDHGDIVAALVQDEFVGHCGIPLRLVDRLTVNGTGC